MATLPVFPLGSVLFPAMPCALRIFEERYVVLLSRVLLEQPAEFGVVLIERGSEVGGGDHRFRVGTVARITRWRAGEEGLVAVLAQGGRRFEVVRWLADDPHPRAETRPLPDLVWAPELAALREEAERVVRRTLAMASEFGDHPWSPDVELSDDPVACAWQLAGIAPIGPLDQQRLLGSTSTAELLRGVVEHTLAAAETLTGYWPDEPGGARP